jgi:hypothetical protein
VSDLRAVYFVNDNTGIVTGTGGTILRTTNAGVTWSIISAGVVNNFYTVSFANENTGTIAGTGKVMRTTNGGMNWENQSINYSNDLYSMDFVNANTGWAAGQLGAIFRTERGGVGVNQISSQVPEKFALLQNYPNPFNPSTIINFQLTINSYVNLKVYDMNGKEIATLVNENLHAGEYEIKWSADNISGGVYFYTLETENFKDTRRMILLK